MFLETKKLPLRYYATLVAGDPSTTQRDDTAFYLTV